MPLPTIWTTRLAVSKVLFYCLGYLSPALNSTKAIISKDDEGIREYLTYWCVFGLLLYVEFLLNFFSALRNWPPESKVLFILWLTLPQFQGAFRIYSILLRPYFEKYEDEIDKQISNISKGVSEKAHRHIQTILWQLFLAPNDGLLAGALSISSSFSSSNLINTFLQKQDTDMSLTQSSSQDHLQQQQQAMTSSSLRKQLLDNFSEMLVEGIYADVWYNSSGPQSQVLVDTEMQVCRVSLMRGGFYLQLVQQPDDECVTGRVSDQISDSSHPCTLIQDPVLVPLLWVAGVSADNLNPNTVILIVSISLSPSTAKGPAQIEMKSVFLRVENEEEAEALLAGLTVLCADSKKRVAKTLHRATQPILKLSALAAAFKSWRSLCR